MPDLQEIDRTISKILALNTIAVVGMSPKPDRPSHRVGQYLSDQGFQIYPVHPVAEHVAGLPCYPSLTKIPTPVDIVDVFRRPEFCLDIARIAIEIGAKALWLQEGIVNNEAIDLARNAGLLAIQDRCLLKEHRRSFQ